MWALDGAGTAAWAVLHQEMRVTSFTRISSRGAEVDAIVKVNSVAIAWTSTVNLTTNAARPVGLEKIFPGRSDRPPPGHPWLSPERRGKTHSDEPELTR